METLQAILTRRSIRQYTAQTVADKLVKELLAAAMQAPSAGNQRPWHFVVATERTTLNNLAGVLPNGQMLKTAPLAVAICADLALEKYPGYWAQDCSAATQNLLLAAHASGLGAVWLGVYPVEERVRNVRRQLDLPEQVVPLCVVSIGYPAETKPPIDRYEESRVHHNQW